jgi:hypothetical protein
MLRKSNRGYVTVLVSVLFGLAFTATVLGTAGYIRSTQALSMATHAQVQAQLRAWTGVEVVREYLAALQTSNNLTALAGVVNTQNVPLTLSGVSGVTATLTAVDSATSPTLFTAEITGTTAQNTPAWTTSTIQAVYSVQSGGGGGSNFTAALNFNRSLVLGGSIKVVQATGSTTQYSINVLGDLSTGGNTITGVSVINATGTINIGSGSSFQTLNSNCDVVLSGSVNAVTVNAQRNICETGGAYVSGTALANGSVSSQATSSYNGTISALANPTGSASCEAPGYSSGSTTNATTCPAPSFAGVNLSAGGAGAATVNSDGSVSLGSGGYIGNVDDEGNLTVASGATVNAGTYGGTLTVGSGATVKATKVTPNTVTITPAVAVSLSTAQFNAYTLQSVANYAFTVNSNGNAQVAVSNVHNITNGTYYIGQYGGGYDDYLCASPSSIGTSLTVTCGTGSPPAGALRICTGYSTTYSECFSYSSGKWTISTGASFTLPPGIDWFQGNLNLNGGTYYNTFVATGNITTAASIVVYAPNYAGYSGTNGTGICSNNSYPNNYPMQFCTISTTTFNSNASSGIGNYALLAGSWVGSSYPGQAGYVGGNITLGSSNSIYGNIKAGNEFQSGGSSTIAGGITALAQGTAVENSMGGSTTLNYSNIPPTLSIGGGGSGTTSSGSGTGTGSGSGSGAGIVIQWARYL